MDFVGKPNALVRTVAEGLVGGVAATAKRDFRPVGEPEGFSSGIDDFEVTFDPQRTVVRGSDFRCGHGYLRQEFTGAAPSNKPLRYVGTRPNSTRGFLCTLLCLFLWSAKTPFDRGIHPCKNVTDPRRILLMLKSDRAFRSHNRELLEKAKALLRLSLLDPNLVS